MAQLVHPWPAGLRWSAIHLFPRHGLREKEARATCLRGDEKEPAFPADHTTAQW